MSDKKVEWKPPKAVQKSHQKIMQEIGAKLEKLRNDIPASRFAKDLGISRNSYRLMEKGEIYFSMENFLKVLEFHGVSISDFFSKDIEDL
jgi:DNA-binding XRE family transcriptional regulator